MVHKELAPVKDRIMEEIKAVCAKCINKEPYSEKCKECMTFETGDIENDSLDVHINLINFTNGEGSEHEEGISP